jgi:DNA adenine methylase
MSTKSVNELLGHLPLKFYGGKGNHYGRLAKWIASFFPPHMTFLDAFAGGCTVLLARDPDDKRLWIGEASHNRGVSEVVNDLDGNLTNFFQVLQSEKLFPAFHRKCQVTPFSSMEFTRALDGLRTFTDPVNRAWAYFVHCRLSLGGRGDGFATISFRRTRGGHNEQSNAWVNCVDGLPLVHARLRHVVILNEPGVDAIRRLDHKHTLAYFDPPYPACCRAATDVFEHEMSDADHVELLETLAAMKGKFLLSSFPNPLYQQFATRCGWHLETFDRAIDSSQGEVKRIATEHLWMNFRPKQRFRVTVRRTVNSGAEA